MADRITSIEFSNTLGDTPASTHRPSGKVWVNSNYLGGTMRKRYWDFILAHEEGHIVLDTKSELEADAYASVKFFNKYPLDPFDSVKAITEVLPVNTAEQKLRVKLQEARAAKFDCEHNQKNCRMITKNTSVNPKNNIGLDAIDVIERRANAGPIPKQNIGLDAISVIEQPKKFDPEFSHFTDCSKYNKNLYPNKIKVCQQQNKEEREAQIELARIASEDKKATTDAQGETARQLAALLASSDVNTGASQTANAGGGSKNVILILVLVSAAISVGLVLYFMGDKKP